MPATAPGGITVSVARFSATRPEVNGDCITVKVDAAEPADVANRLAARAGGTINVAATAAASPADADVPTVWIPDSSAWITRMQGVNREAFEADPTPVAASLVVVAAAEPVAKSLGAGTVGAQQVAALLAKVGAKELQVGSVDPRRSTAGLAGAGLLYDAIVTEPAKLVVAPDAAALLKAPARQVSLTSEQAVLAGPDGGQVTLPLEPAVTLDYPFAVVAGKPRVSVQAAERFRAALGAAANREAFAKRTASRA
ncbi:substrate-binding domain-containing protein [Dactylosporangium fulvum]|uniref:Substrate-binding domain-containing protein n=1 Tax=Dactylosporangium fulvum TaxID=53359 RepID=A0ABY5VY88_9ACTN|nr:substrate-binding domain-containing protein [Dactylosporangium fulvum]UWP82683.1 substrate-binding domain-containing protein [Dactylosporangium fulvum]